MMGHSGRRRERCHPYGGYQDISMTIRVRGCRCTCDGQLSNDGIVVAAKVGTPSSGDVATAGFPISSPGREVGRAVAAVQVAALPAIIGGAAPVPIKTPATWAAPVGQ